MPVTFFRVFAGLISTYLLMAFFITLGAGYPAYLSSKIAPADTHYELNKPIFPSWKGIDKNQGCSGKTRYSLDF